MPGAGSVSPETGPHFCYWEVLQRRARRTPAKSRVCTTKTDGRMLSGIESTETHEYAETLTDFWPTNGWYDSSGGEIGDECVNLDAYETLSTGTYDVQGLWSNNADNCVTSG